MKQVGSGEPYTGLFFGQSSLSNFSIAKDTSVVNVTSLVKNEEELKIFAPMGCGFMTGAATVTTLTNAGKEDSVCVMGLGAVGLAAIMVWPDPDFAEKLIVHRLPKFKDAIRSSGSIVSRPASIWQESWVLRMF
jgi:Zn-dependent alcohol dehydrogenase